jgi:hypothetical protein
VSLGTYTARDSHGADNEIKKEEQREGTIEERPTERGAISKGVPLTHSS